MRLTKTYKRIALYVTVFFGLSLFAYTLRGSDWEGSAELHTLMEVVATLLALLVGVMALINYYTNRNDTFLFIGAGFLGTAFLDAYHALVTSTLFSVFFPTPLPSLAPWSWVASRIFLAIVVFLSWYVWFRVKNRRKQKPASPKLIYISFSIFTLAAFAFFAFVPLPRAYYPELFFGRPEEFVPALFFLLAFIGYFFKGKWKTESFEHWLMLFLVVSFSGQVMLMSFSTYLFDFQFDATHFLKKVSYVCVLIGLLVSMYQSFRSERTARESLLEQQKVLRAEQKDKERILVELEMRSKQERKNVAELEKTKEATLNILEDLEQERKNLAREKAQSDAIFENVAEGLVFTDKEGRVLLANRYTIETLGYNDFSECKGQKWEQFVSVSNEKGKRIPSAQLPINQVLSGKRDIVSRDLQKALFYKRRDGTFLPVTVVVSSVVVEGEKVGAIIVFRDITKDREVDKAKSEFVSLASHQLRTPLSTINWYSEMLIEGDAGELNSDQETYVKEIYGGSQRMVELVNALLNVSRLELGTFVVEPEDTDLVELAKSVVKEQEPSVQTRKIDLTVRIEQVPHLMVDPKLVRMIFQNLLSNAIKYTPEGGKAWFTLEEKKKGEVVGGKTLEKDGVLFTMSDAGLGIPKDEHKNIFQKLYRAQNVRQSDTEGTGLGLYLVKAIVERCSGDIWFESEKDKGTVFHVLLALSGMQSETKKKS